MAFNLKKTSQTKSYENMLRENNKEHGLEAQDDAVNYDKGLEEVRKDPDGLKILEHNLDDVRVNKKEDDIISEKKLDKGFNSWLKSRVDEMAEHPSTYHKEHEEDYKKALAKEEKKDKKDKPFYEKYVGDELMGDSKKIKNNVQPSQLFSNFEDREDFRKQNKSASLNLFDADAMIYHIYRTASSQGRDVNSEEQSQIDKINNEKIQILSQSEYNFLEEFAPGVGEQEQNIIEMDDKSDVSSEELNKEEFPNLVDIPPQDVGINEKQDFPMESDSEDFSGEEDSIYEEIAKQEEEMLKRNPEEIF